MELTPREYALLEAHSKQPVSFSQMQREARSGTNETTAIRNKLKLILDFNRNLQTPVAQSPPAPAELVNNSVEVEAFKQNADVETRDSDAAISRLLSVFTDGLTDERFQRAAAILQNENLNANEKLTKVDAVIRLPATASAERLGQLVGVSKQTVLKSAWWIQHRKGEKADEVGRRHNVHVDRAKQNEPTRLRDDDE